MESGKIKIETETPEYNIKMLQPLPRSDSFDMEFEKHIINETEQLKKLSDVGMIKTEEGLNFHKNQMLLKINNDLWEPKNQILEKNPVMGAYQVHDEMKFAKMTTEIEELKLQKQVDNEIIENLRCRILVLEEDNKTMGRNLEEMKRREMEADRAAKLMASELLKADEIVKELNVEHLKNMVVGATGIVSCGSSNHEIIEIIDDFDDDNDKGKHASNSPVCVKDHQTKKRNKYQQIAVMCTDGYHNVNEQDDEEEEEEI